MNESRYLAEGSRFQDHGEAHDLPKIAHYFSESILRHELKKNVGAGDFIELVLNQVMELRSKPQKLKVKIVSLGAGHGQIEREILRQIINLSPGNTEIVCLDLFSPDDRESISVDGNQYVYIRKKIDLNTSEYVGNFDFVLVHHALHHFLELEIVFEKIKAMLAVLGGKLIVSDVVGRNGHMRWPETLRAIRQIWHHLPLEKKYHYQFNKYDYWFENWDCSMEGFEGIRAEDILKVLFSNFKINFAFFWGGMSDVFIDRGFGPNYDPNVTTDLDIITKIICIEKRLTQMGLITPTQVIGVFSPTFNEQLQPINNFFLIKKFMVGLSPKTAKFIDDTVHEFFGNSPVKNRMALKLPLRFTNSEGQIDNFLREGWDCSDQSSIWAVGLHSRICFENYAVKPKKISITGNIHTKSEFNTIKISDTEGNKFKSDLISGTMLITIPENFGELHNIELFFQETYKVDFGKSPEARPLTYHLESILLEP